MTNEPTYYELLGVSRDADTADIKTAFRLQALRNHPDQGGNPVLFRMLEHAYETLTNPSKREEYDVWLSSFGAGTPPRGTYIPQYMRDEWERDEPTYVNDREPVVEPAPMYVRDGPMQEVSQYEPVLFERPTSHRSLIAFEAALRWARNLFVVWFVIALVCEFTVVPGFSNRQVLGLMLILLFSWLLGSVALRLAGWILGIFAVVEAYNQIAPPVVTLGRLAIAFCLWLAGQWVYAFKRGKWNSAVAFGLLHRLPGYLRPDYRFLRAGVSDVGR